jgi:O-antigen ligase
VLAVVALVAEKDLLLRMVSQGARLNRVADTINAVYEGNLRSSGLGTYQFRRGLYQHAVKALTESSLLELSFGHGTSNGRLLLGMMIRTGDANRAVHNEWLRILYEWGSVGLALWFVFIFSVIAYAVQGVRRDRLGHARPLLIFLPAFLAGFSTENVLAGAGPSRCRFLMYRLIRRRALPPSAPICCRIPCAARRYESSPASQLLPAGRW